MRIGRTGLRWGNHPQMGHRNTDLLQQQNVQPSARLVLLNSLLWSRKEARIPIRRYSSTRRLSGAVDLLVALEWYEAPAAHSVVHRSSALGILRHR